MRIQILALTFAILLAATPSPGEVCASLRLRLGRFYTGVMPVDRAVDLFLGREPRY